MNFFQRWRGTDRQMVIGTLCDAGRSRRTHLSAMKHLAQSPEEFRPDEVQHFLVYLSNEGLKPEHVSMFLELLTMALAEHPEFSNRMATETTAETARTIWRHLCFNDNPQVQKRLCEVLEVLNIPKRLVIEQRLMEAMLWILEQEAIRQNQIRSPIARAVLHVLARRFDCFVFDTKPIRERVCEVAVTLMMCDPFNRTVLRLVFLFLEKLAHLLGPRLLHLYALFRDIFDECHSNIDPQRFKHRTANIYLCLGGMACIAIHHDIRVEDATECTLRHLWNLAAMVDAVPPDRVVTQCTALKIVSSTMKLLTVAARQNPQFSQLSGAILWHPKLRGQCYIRKEVRFILMESSEPAVPKQFSLHLLSPQQMAKVFRYHGISEDACERCTMSGVTFLNKGLEFYKFHQGLSQQEQLKLQQFLEVHRCMVDIVHDENCSRVTHDQMERRLQMQPHYPYPNLIRCLQDEDGHYYFDDLVRCGHLLGPLCPQPSES